MMLTEKLPDNYTLVICEKPAAARRIAESINEKGLIQSDFGKVNFYVVNTKESNYVICSARGHLYSIADPNKLRNIFPIFDVDWIPNDIIDPKRSDTYKRLRLIKKLSSNAKLFMNACDLDLEGETIGYNILKYACGEKQNQALRVKFSVLTTDELKKAFKKAFKSNKNGLALAGRTRHFIDFLFGINLSRALSESYYNTKKVFRIISIGRVQGPTLSFVINKEVEIRNFVSLPFWKVFLKFERNNKIWIANYIIKSIKYFPEVKRIIEECKNKYVIVKEINNSILEKNPPYPFNLGDLQKEAYRLFNFSPSDTLKIAEKLYLEALISYPRTSSQKLPYSINYKKILLGLQKNKKYSISSRDLLAGKLKPNQGKKIDSAHPAIYPTGEKPQDRIGSKEKQIYDLIVSRFLSVFSRSVIIKKITILFKIGNHVFTLSGQKIVSDGWLSYYKKYSYVREISLPNITQGEKISEYLLVHEEKLNPPPSRYNQSSLLDKMEREDIGTKGTRADIIKTLIDRGYVTANPIVPTEIAFTVYDILNKHSPQVLSSYLTRRIERYLQKIEKNEINENYVIQLIVNEILESLTQIKKKEKEIGEEISNSIKNTIVRKNRLGICPRCEKGYLTIIRSRKTHKRFVGCSNYSKGCSNSVPLPQKGKLLKIKKMCSICGWPILLVRDKGINWSLCINIKCDSKRRENGISPV